MLPDNIRCTITKAAVTGVGPGGEAHPEEEGGGGRVLQAGLAMRGKVQRRKQLSWSRGRGARLWHQEEVRFQRPAWSHGGHEASRRRPRAKP